jgi:hypothetical protein
MSRTLNLIGLVISLIAAGLMYFFPFYTTPVVQEKPHSYAEPIVWTGAGKVPRWKVYLAKLGPILLAVGFLLQIIAALT